MSHPPTGSDGSTPPGGVPQPPNPPAGSPYEPAPPAGSPYPAPQQPAGSPHPAPQQPAGPPGGATTYASGSAAVPAEGYRQGAGNPADANPTLAMPPVAYPAGYPASAHYDQQAYPSAEGHGDGAPQGGYPGQVGPASAPPFGAGSGMASGQPAYPGAQMSGPPFGQPTSGTPMSGLPYGAPAPAPAPGAPGKGRTVLVLALVAALLFVVGGVMSGLFVAKSSELNRTERELRAQVSDRDTKIEANTKEIDRLKRELEAANDKIGSVEQDLTGTKNDRDELERQKQVISKCLDLLGEAATATTRSTYDKAMKEADKVCDEADRYL